MQFMVDRLTPKYIAMEFPNRSVVFRKLHSIMELVYTFSTIEEAKQVAKDCNAIAHFETVKP